MKKKDKIAYLKEERMWLRILLQRLCNDDRMNKDMKDEAMRELDSITKVYAFENQEDFDEKKDTD